MWFSVGRFAPLLLWRAGVLCCRVVDKLTGVFWWWGGVACADRESEWRCKWSLETAGFCEMCSNFRTRCAKKALTEPWRASGCRLWTVSITQTKSKQCLNDTPTSTQIPYPHKPPLPDTKKGGYYEGYIYC